MTRDQAAAFLAALPPAPPHPDPCDESGSRKECRQCRHTGPLVSTADDDGTTMLVHKACRTRLFRRRTADRFASA